MLSKQIEDSQREIGEKLGEVQTEFGEKLREVQAGLSEDFGDLRGDVVGLEGTIAGAGIGNADVANSGRDVSDYPAANWRDKRRERASACSSNPLGRMVTARLLGKQASRLTVPSG